MSNNKWDRLPEPPAPLFLNNKERGLVKQINDELIEKVLSMQVAYYPLDRPTTNYHPLYGEAIQKSFLPPIRVYALILWEETEQSASGEGIDHLPEITIHFHKRRLTEDQDLYVRPGDFVSYGNDFYEIMSVQEPKELFGQTNYKMEISAKCIKSREGLFDAS